MSLSNSLLRSITILLFFSFFISSSSLLSAEASREVARVVLYPHKQCLLSSEVSARVTAVVRKMGECFKKGEPLVKLDPAAYQARKERAEAELRLAEVELKATEHLFQTKSKSRIDVERARALVVRAKSAFLIAENELIACVISAPFDGRVVKVQVREYNLVQRAEPLITVVNDDIIEGRYLLSSNLFKSLRIGQKVTVWVDEVEKEVAGTVSRISPVLDPSSGTIEVHAEFKNSDGQLRGGMKGHLLKASAITEKTGTEKL